MVPADEVQIFDLQRMFLGELSGWFLLEVGFRTAWMYMYTVLLVRTLTPRTVGQLSLVELLLVVGLGSAVGDPMFYPDVPLLHGMLVVSIIVFLNRGFSALSFRSKRFETLIDGAPHRLVHLGVLDLDGMRDAELAREQLFEMLRIEGIEQLGQVRAAYLEQNGHLSVFRQPRGQERDGRVIEPPEDLAPPPRFSRGEAATSGDRYACANCARVQLVSAGSAFPSCECGVGDWLQAVSGPGERAAV